MSWLPEWLSRAITPESYGEKIVNDIYGPGGTAQRGQADPNYDVHDLSSPTVFVAAKGAITSAGSALLGNLKLPALIFGAFILIAVFVFGLSRRI